MAPTGTPFARTPLVVAMPAPMAQALGYPRRQVGWSDLEQLAREPRGLGRVRASRMGTVPARQGQPQLVDDRSRPDDRARRVAGAPRAGARALEQSVVYYGDSSAGVLRQLATARDEVDRERAHVPVGGDHRRAIRRRVQHGRTRQSDVASSARAASALPLVAIYPTDAAIESDNPIIVLDAPWSSATARAGARLFTRFALQPATQAKVRGGRASGPRGARPARDLLGAANGVDSDAHRRPVAPASPAEIEQALDALAGEPPAAPACSSCSTSPTRWAIPPIPRSQTARRSSRVAQAALPDALDQLAPDDEIGLRIFTTEAREPVSPNWQRRRADRTASRRAARALRHGDRALDAAAGSPLYAATRDAFDAVARHADPQRINAVVVLTDGYNEDDHDNNLTALLAHLATNPTSASSRSRTATTPTTRR